MSGPGGGHRCEMSEAGDARCGYRTTPRNPAIRRTPVALHTSASVGRAGAWGPPPQSPPHTVYSQQTCVPRPRTCTLPCERRVLQQAAQRAVPAQHRQITKKKCTIAQLPAGPELGHRSVEGAGLVLCGLWPRGCELHCIMNCMRTTRGRMLQKRMTVGWADAN